MNYRSQGILMERLERKEREFKARQAEILAQAEKIFAAKGFHNVTMAEIASVSGFSIGSLYQFFKSKENLYSTMICEKLDLMYGQIRDEVENVENIIGKVEALIRAQLQFVEKNTDFCRLFLRGETAALSEIMTSLQEKLIDAYRHHLLFMENILKSGVKNGSLRSLPAREMARALFGLIRSSAIDWLISQSQESLISQKDFIMDIFLRGEKI
jgi:AcrR family transcriptional regulator